MCPSFFDINFIIFLYLFEILDSLHSSVKETTPKYVSFFGMCKMWDNSWKPLEHPDFTDKPFIENDYDNWWSLKYTMSADEMYKINEKVEELEICCNQKEY